MADVVIPVARPCLGEAEADAARRVILSGWVTQGPEVAAFEKEFASAVGAAHACAVSSATTALHLALLGVGVGPGDDVVTVSHSFIATANAIRYCGANPRFVDVELGTFNLDPALLAEAITPRTRAILVVHQLGMPADLTALLKVARARNVPVVEDAACAVGSELVVDGAWQRVGKPLGDVVCFSFHPRKVLTTGDGGMLTTSDGALDQKFRRWRQHSMSVPDTVRHSSAQVIFESYPELGFNYRMTDIQAAVGRVQLTRLAGLISRRRELAARYHERLAGIPGLRLPHEPAWARSNWQTYCVLLPNGADQKTVMQRMLNAGVSTRRGVMNAHREAPYANLPHPPLPNSEHIQDHGVALPLFHDMTEAQQDVVVAALRRALEGGA
ncbi:MAG: DegT/DnrJ/EryC1/StrS family aminotransferase [Myxococcota bacterium]